MTYFIHTVPRVMLHLRGRQYDLKFISWYFFFFMCFVVSYHNITKNKRDIPLKHDSTSFQSVGSVRVCIKRKKDLKTKVYRN